MLKHLLHQDGLTLLMHGKKAQDDKEVAYKAFLKNLTESHYYGYMNLPESGENLEYDHSFFTISPQDGSKNFISVYTSLKRIKKAVLRNLKHQCQEEK